MTAAAPQELERLSLYLLHVQPRAVHARHRPHRIARRRSRRIPHLPSHTASDTSRTCFSYCFGPCSGSRTGQSSCQNWPFAENHSGTADAMNNSTHSSDTYSLSDITGVDGMKKGEREATSSSSSSIRCSATYQASRAADSRSDSSAHNFTLQAYASTNHQQFAGLGFFNLPSQEWLPWGHLLSRCINISWVWVSHCSK